MVRILFCMTLVAVASAAVAEPVLGPVKPVAPDAAGPTSFGKFHLSPESPDGRHLVFVEYSRPSRENRRDARPAVLRVADRETLQSRVVAEIGSAVNHDGQQPVWLDDRHVLYRDGDRNFTVDIETGERVGAAIPGWVGRNVHEGKVLVSDSEAALGRAGIHLVDPFTGKAMLILNRDELNAAVAPLLGEDVNSHVRHLQFNPSGTRIAFRVNHRPRPGEPRPERADETRRLLLTADADGGNLVVFGPKPMHFVWYDDDTLAGQDNQIDDGLRNNKVTRRWDRHANVVETLAGFGCHMGFSPDRQWFASESWYRQDPVVLRLYRKGETAPADSVVVTDEHAETVWTHGVHVNPSFSRDGRRLYFNQAIGEGDFRAVFVEIRPRPWQVEEVLQDGFGDGSLWHAELEADGTVAIRDDVMSIDVPRGATVWFKPELEQPVRVSYTLTAVDEGGPNDRVSDANCFFMASDPRDDDFWNAPRTGKFSTYHELRTYYAGIGGNDNTTTRFRRYIGDPKRRPLLPEHDLTDELLEPDVPTRIELIAFDDVVTLRRDGRTVFEYEDPEPYRSGRFGFRTVNSHLRITDFRVEALEPK
jgi:hypothetical protein